MSETCGSGCGLYICPTSGETECIEHGGFDACCDHPRCPSRMTADHPTREGQYAADAEAAWLDYRNDYLRQNPWCDPRRAGRQMRKREFVAGYVAAALVAADPAPAQPDAGLTKRLHDERSNGGSLNVDCWACEAARSPAIADLLRATEALSVLDAIKAVREQAAAERVSMHDRGEALTDYSSGVLDGIDNAMLAAKKAVHRPEDRREVTSLEEWWACEDAYQAGIDHALATRAAQPVPAPEVSRGVAEACGCFACIGNEPAYPGTWLTVGMTRMILCSKCGNKRCPHGTDHRNACTGSNEPGQVGSRYGSAHPADDGADCCRERTTSGGCGCES